MILRREVETAWRTPSTQLHVAMLVFAFRHTGMRQVGQAQGKVVESGLRRGKGFFSGLHLRAEVLHFSKQRRHVLALRLGLANVLGANVPFITQAFHFQRGSLAALLDGGKRGNIEFEPATGQLRGHRRDVAPQEFRFKHLSSP